MDWPIGLPTRAGKLANVYEAAQSWKSAPKKSAWSDANPGAWDTVSAIINLKREQRKREREQENG